MISKLWKFKFSKNVKKNREKYGFLTYTHKKITPYRELFGALVFEVILYCFSKTLKLQYLQ